MSRVPASVAPVLAWGKVFLGVMAGHWDHGPLVGRSQERAQLEQFFDRVPAGAAALVLEGEAGIGKTALWQAGLEMADRRGWRVLVARPAEAETGFSFAAFEDLFENVGETELAVLPAPQRSALAVALLWEEAAGPFDHRTLGTAVLGVLRHLARDGPLVIALDDLQWLDPATARLLSFAVRRLGPAPVGVLATRRSGPDSTDPLDLAQAFGPRLHRLTVPPLAAEELRAIVSARLGVRLPGPLAERIHATSAGNPFFGLELARALQAGGRPAPPCGAPLPVPTNLRQLVRDDLARLSPPARLAVLVASASAAPTTALLERILGAAAAGALTEARDAGIIGPGPGAVRFTHPLLASTAYLDAGAAERRRVHGQLAELVADREEAARHRALAATEPDEAVAQALEESAAAAAARGAFDTAADLAERAAVLTPPDLAGGAQRRMVAAAGQHLRTGEHERAMTLLDRAVSEAPAGPQRAAALRLIGGVHLHRRDLAPAAAALRQACDEAGDDRALRGRVLLDLAYASLHLGDRPEGRRAAHAALTDARAAGDEGLLADALALSAAADFMAGVPLDGRMESALALEEPEGRWSAWTRQDSTPSVVAAFVWLCAGRLIEAKQAVDRAYGWAQERGSHGSIQFWLVAVWVACSLGDPDSADRYIAAYRSASFDEPGGPIERAVLLGEARTAALRGDAPSARTLLDQAEELWGGSLGAAPYLVQVWGALEVSLGNWAEVDGLHGRFRQAVAAQGIVNPGAVPFLLDEAEALIMLGRPEEAEVCLAGVEEQATRLSLGWVLAGVARNRALLAAARGDLDGARAAAGQAVAGIGPFPMPVERGRALLVQGQIERRGKRKSAAKVALQGALGEFEAAGAGAWAARARAELQRLGVRPPTPLALTPTEAQVASLVALGLTNRQIGEQVFLTAKSVEGVLSRIYRKTGLTSRAALAAHLATTPASGQAGTAG